MTSPADRKTLLSLLWIFVFIACVEIGAALTIVGYAWTWRSVEGAGR